LIAMYIKRAGGDRKKAAQMATDDGFDVTRK